MRTIAAIGARRLVSPSACALRHRRASMTKSPANISPHATQMSIPADTAAITPCRSARCAVRGDGRGWGGERESASEKG